jgi:hypothetical protein
MVTHRTANFIMLISNLPSVRSSRFKPNVGSRVIRLSLSLPFSLSFSFSFYSHTMSFFCQIWSSSFASYICTATKTTTSTTMKTTIFSFVFFSFLHIDIHIYIRFIRSPSGERKKKGRTFATTAIKFIYILSLSLSLLYSSLQ